MLPAPSVRMAQGGKHVTRTLAEACQGLRLSNHWSVLIRTYEQSPVLSRRRDSDAIRNACSLAQNKHGKVLLWGQSRSVNGSFTP